MPPELLPNIAPDSPVPVPPAPGQLKLFTAFATISLAGSGAGVRPGRHPGPAPPMTAEEFTATPARCQFLPVPTPSTAAWSPQPSPVASLIATLAVMSLLVVGGARPPSPEMHRIAQWKFGAG